MKAQRHFPTIGLLLFFGLLCMGRPAAAKNDCERSRQLIEQGAGETNQRRRLELFRQAVELCPQADGPHFYLGLALEEREDQKFDSDYRAAEKAYRLALEINPEHYGALFKLAGLEYISGQFDNARTHYDRYLELDAPTEHNDTTRQAAANLSAKCAWLAHLPAGSINAKALTRDPDRFAGVPTLIGEIAMELGRSAMEVTGNLGYGLAGAGVSIGMGLLENSKDMGYRKLVKTYNKEDYRTAYDLAMNKLPQTVNQHGINSDMVFHMLRIISFSAYKANVPSQEQGPFQLGFLQMSPKYLQLDEHYWSAMQTYPWFWEILTAYRQTGWYFFDRKEYHQALNCFQRGSEHLTRYGGLFRNGERIPSDEDASLEKHDLLNRIYQEFVRAAVDSTHSAALQSLLDLHREIQAHPSGRSDAHLHGELVATFETWGFYDQWRMTDNYKDVRDLAKLARFTNEYARNPVHDSLTFFLRRTLFRSYVDWGEYGLAFQELEKINPYLQGGYSNSLNDYTNLAAAGLHNRTFLTGFVPVYLERLPPEWGNRLYVEKLSSALRLLLRKQPADAFPLLLECKRMEENDTAFHNQTLGCAGILWQVSTAVGNDSDRLPLEQMYRQWEELAQRNWPAFRQAALDLVYAMIAWKDGDPQKQLLFDRLLDLFLQHPQATYEDQQQLRHLYYRVTGQFEKALSICQDLGTLQGPLPPSSTREYLLDRYLALSAIYRHETGDFAAAMRDRRELLNRLLPYQDILPENVADAKVRLAESMAANGHYPEALALIMDANRTFTGFWPNAVTARHQRAQESTSRILAENRNVGMKGIMALMFCR